MTSSIAELAPSGLTPAQPRDPRPCRAPGADPDLWFPESGDHVAAAAAKALCGPCPDRAACLAGALARNELFGVWGGLTAHERMALPRTHPCRRCNGPAPLGASYCGDPCRDAARRAVQARSARKHAGQRIAARRARQLARAAVAS
jgi:hypothetical protein